MRWFINSTKETSGFNDNNNYQTQIDAINGRLGAWSRNIEKIESRISESLHDKGIQINNILKQQGNQDERIDELEKGTDKFKELLRAAFNTITDLDNKVKALENKNMPKQANGKKLPKFRRIANSYADHKFDKVFQIAMGYSATGMKQREIASRLNSMNIKTATGSEFDQKAVSKLLQNQIQKARFMKGKERKPKL